jgi:hypothetical protein
MPKGIESRLDQGMNLLGLTHISAYWQRLYALRYGFVCDSTEMVHITAREHQVCPISRHAKGNATPDTRATSGDENDFVVQDAVCKDAHDTTRLVEQDLSRIWNKD